MCPSYLYPTGTPWGVMGGQDISGVLPDNFPSITFRLVNRIMATPGLITSISDNRRALRLNCGDKTGIILTSKQKGLNLI